MTFPVPPVIDRWLPAPKRAFIATFLRFGTVGVVGFVFDTLTVYAVRGIAGLYVAGLAAYLVAATVVWTLNRAWTFRGRSTSNSLFRQWVLFLGANLFGFTLNRGAYVLLITFSPFCAEYPVLAVAAGAVAGMFVNFDLSRRIVFR